MTDPVVRLARAEVAAAVARHRLNLTLTALQRRLKPRRLARDTARELTDAGSLATRRTAAAARDNPGALAGLVAAAGLFLARHRIVALIRRPEATRPEATGDDAAS